MHSDRHIVARSQGVDNDAAQLIAMGGAVYVPFECVGLVCKPSWGGAYYLSLTLP